MAPLTFRWKSVFEESGSSLVAMFLCLCYAFYAGAFWEAKFPSTEAVEELRVS